MHTVDQRIAAEVLAISVCSLFPGAQLLDKKVSLHGFFYDIFLEQPVDAQALPLLEEKMRAIIKENYPVKGLEMMRENAAQLFLHVGQSLKAETILQAPSNLVPLVKIGEFYDDMLGEGEFSEGDLSIAGVIKLVSVTHVTRFLKEVGELNVTRIEGIAAVNPQTLKKVFKKYQNAKDYDPLKLGQDLELFSTHSALMEGCLFWKPKGVVFRDLLLGLWKETMHSAGFRQVYVPGIVSSEAPSAYLFEMEEKFYSLSPERISLVVSSLASESIHEQELPLRLAECSEKFNPIPEVEQLGLYASRLYTGDRFFVFCKEEELLQELISSLQFFAKTYTMLNFRYQWYLVASKTQASKGTSAEWKHAAAWLAKALAKAGLSYHHENRQLVENGPRIELRLYDGFDREWVTSWVEVNMLYPKRFRLSYRSSDSEAHPLLMLQGTLCLSLERLTALLLESACGCLPLWLAPEQVRLLPIGKRHLKRAEAVSTTLKNNGFRVGMDLTDLPLGGKVHLAEKAKIPYIIILGDKEERKETITVRFRKEKEKQAVDASIKLDELLQQLEIEKLRS